jgi:hypothetical protein
VKLDSRVNLMVWQAAFLAGFAVVYGIDNDYSNNSLAEMVLYNGFQRLAWSLALGWVIFSCTKGLSKKKQSYTEITHYPFSLVLCKVYFDRSQRDSHAVHYI